MVEIVSAANSGRSFTGIAPVIAKPGCTTALFSKIEHETKRCDGGMQVGDETWAEVRLAYTDGSAPLKEIAALFGLTPQRIGARAKREGWSRPPGTEDGARPKRATEHKPAVAASKITSAGVAKQSGRLPTKTAQRAVIARLYRAITVKLEHMERRMASGEDRSAQDEERESRALATLISNFEKVTEAVAGLEDNRGASRARGAAGADAERMRREIAESLERLGGGGPPARGSGRPRS
jgi:hypothetical protein